MAFFSSLNREQKEATGLLQVGTFLEYFDLMLYVHMAVVLNELFFPVTDSKTASLIAAFAFCSTYVLRPFGALIFGYLGDHVGRKTTVVLTTLMMSMSCVIMATLPTYAQIGITAAWLVTLCRVVQGFSSMGEIIGAEIYLTEITKPPASYPIVGLIGCASRLGTMAALGISTLVTLYQFEWRNAFWIGAAVSVVGSVARTRLRETPDFIKAKETSSQKKKQLNRLWQKEGGWKILTSFFLIYAGPPVCLYFTYIYCGILLKNLGCGAQHILAQNFFISFFELLSMIIAVLLSYRIHPLKIIKFKAILFVPFVIIVPFLMNTTPSVLTIFLIQIISVCVTLSPVPAVACMMKHFPVFRRFTYTSFMYALSRAVMHVVSSFGLVYLTEFFGHWGIYFILLPVAGGFLWGVKHFKKMHFSS